VDVGGGTYVVATEETCVGLNMWPEKA
jgi:hypothetical protein